MSPNRQSALKEDLADYECFSIMHVRLYEHFECISLQDTVCFFYGMLSKLHYKAIQNEFIKFQLISCQEILSLTTRTVLLPKNETFTKSSV